MRRILFFVNNNWVFGKIHNALIKTLYPEYLCDIRCWTTNLSDLEAKYFNEKYDLFISTPEGCHHLATQSGIPYDKLVAVAHADWDIHVAVTQNGMTYENFQALRGYAVICPLMQQISFVYGIPRIPAVLPVGVTCADYVRPPSQALNRIGYFGKYERTLSSSLDIKRGYLAERVAKEAGVELVRQESVHFLVTESLYKSVDLVMFCSLIEGNPYVALESFAAGVPVLGTATGIFPELAKSGGGGILPFEEEEFVANAAEVIRALQENPDLYQRMSTAALAESKKHDWSVLKQTWLEFLQSLS